MPAGICELDRGYLTAEAWHRDPRYVVTGEFITLAQVEDTFNYDLVLVPAQAMVNGELVESSAHSCVARTNPGHILSTMSPKYGLNQPKSYFVAIAEAVLKAGFTIETVGTLGNGAKAFLSARLPADFDFDFDGYSVGHGVTNFGDSCDGTSQARGSHAMDLVVCQNTFNAYILGVPSLFKVKHTANSEGVIDETLRRLDQSLQTTVQIKAAVERLTNEAFVEAEFRALVAHDALLGARPEDPGKGQTQYDNRFAEIIKRYHADDIEPIRETRMGALMAIQGYEQHVRPIRKGASRVGRTLDEVVFSGQKMAETASKIMGIAPDRAMVLA